MCVFYWPFEAIRVCLLRLAAMRVHQMRVLKMPQKLNLWSDRPGFYPRSHSIEPDISTVVSSPPYVWWGWKFEMWVRNWSLDFKIQNSKEREKAQRKPKTIFSLHEKTPRCLHEFTSSVRLAKAQWDFSALHFLESKWDLYLLSMFILCLSTYCSPLT